MVWSPGRRRLRWVPLRSTTSLFFSVTLYTLIQFWLSTRKTNNNFNYVFTWISDFTNWWMKLTMFYWKGEFNHVSIISLKSSCFCLCSVKIWCFRNVQNFIDVSLGGFDLIKTVYDLSEYPPLLQPNDSCYCFD